MFHVKLIAVITAAAMLLFTETRAQSIKAQQGAVLKRGSYLRISGALITNKRSQFSVVTNQMGIFNILASPGDTLEVAAAGYTSQPVVVSDFKDAIIYLIPVTELDEVLVKGKSLESELKEVQDSWRSKGVYYNGKPPLLASVFHPLTAVNELFGKNAKRARRFNEYAQRELEYQEVSRRFNDLTIKKAVPVTDEELPDFKTEYMPSAEQVRVWSDYDLFLYIKTSYKQFKENKENPIQTGTDPSAGR